MRFMPTGIITGASRGLGLALVRALSDRGWELVVDARGADDLAAAVADLRGVVAIAGDVADPLHRQGLVTAAGSRVDLVVNNASLLGPSRSRRWRTTRCTNWRRVYDVNVFAPLALVQAALPRSGRPRDSRRHDLRCRGRALPGLGGLWVVESGARAGHRILAAEHPEWRVLCRRSGRHAHEMHQEAFPGEDISRSPPPEATASPASWPSSTAIAPSGRYRRTGGHVMQALVRPRSGRRGGEPPEARGVGRDNVRMMVVAGQAAHSLHVSVVARIFAPRRSRRGQHVGHHSGSHRRHAPRR